MGRKRKLSTIEHILDGNLACFVRVEGRISAGQLRSALAHVQRMHPALRALIRHEEDGLYYEADSASEIPLRIMPRVSEDDYRRECETELITEFAYDQPQLRVVCLQSCSESDLLLTTSHRICDGMSTLIIARQMLEALRGREEVAPYNEITVHDIIGDYQPPHPWKRKLAANLLNSLLWLVPESRREPEAIEHYLEWRAGRELSDALKRRCKAEGVSIHAALVVALDRALSAVFGEKLPKWIDNQIDPRRGRFPALKNHMLFLGGGSFKVRTGQEPEACFWSRARAIHQEMPRQIDQELLNIRSRFHFLEMLRPITGGQVQSIMRTVYALNFNHRLNHFALSNLGNVDFDNGDAPFPPKDLRLYVHSFKTRALGWFTYTFNGEMRFYCVSSEKSMTRSQVDAIKREFMLVLQRQALELHETSESRRVGLRDGLNSSLASQDTSGPSLHRSHS